MQFPIHDSASAPAGSRQTLARIQQSYGFLPNLAGVFAESPAALQGLLGAIGAFDAPELTLTPIERQVVLLAASVSNRCEYCVAAHSMLAARNGLEHDQIEALQNGQPLKDRGLEAVRRFAGAVVESRGRVPDAELVAFIDAGYAKAQILEVVLGVALKTLTNYVNHIARPPINEQFAAYAPKQWRQAA